MEKIHGAPSFTLATDLVKAAVTRDGGHLAPVVFTLGHREVSPYALAPWLPNDVASELPVLLKNLRGDFLCFPFGPQANGPPHGETANFEWSRIEQSDHSLRLVIETTDLPARVEKIVSLQPDQTVLYQTHHISELEGKWNYGNHSILDLSGLPEGTGRVTTSPTRWASVYPAAFSNPAEGASQALERGAKFTDLHQVPLASGDTADLTRYPARAGNDDLVMLVNEPASDGQPFAWSAVVLDGYVWFQLKNPIDFPATLLWFSNGGRSAGPWDSRHLGRLGVEEVLSHFCDGIDIARENRLAAEGIPTTRLFKKDEIVSLRIIQGVSTVPQTFGAVAHILPHGENSIRLIGDAGESVTTSVDWKFLL